MKGLSHFCLEPFWTCKQHLIYISILIQTRQPFHFLYKMLIDGLESCGLLWCFHNAVSFSRHPFTAEDPLVSKWCNISPNLLWWRNKLIYMLDGLMVSTFKKKLFWVNYSFKDSVEILRGATVYVDPLCIVTFNCLYLFLIIVMNPALWACSFSQCRWKQYIITTWLLHPILKVNNTNTLQDTLQIISSFSSNHNIITIIDT